MSKLSADGSRIGIKLHEINTMFTVLDEGQKARADSGNHLIAILQSPEKHEQVEAMHYHHSYIIIMVLEYTFCIQIYYIISYLGDRVPS